jgi:large subunit ribosomal protein L15
MKLHHLKPAEGAKKERSRVGRGRAGVRGKTAGRGTKGYLAKHNPKLGFEGGQMPYQRRVPKLKGFNNPNRVEYSVVNVEQLQTVFSKGGGPGAEGASAKARAVASDEEIDPAAMYAHGLVHKGQRVKVLGRGEVSAALVVRAHAFSETAKSKLEQAGGRAEIIG